MGISNSIFDPLGFSKAIAMLPTHITFSFLSAVIIEHLETCTALALQNACLYIFLITESVFKMLGHP